MTTDRTNVTEQRDDFSRFVIHLTRDYAVPNPEDPFEDNVEVAGDNLVSILNRKTIEARNIHCLHGNKLSGVSKAIRDQFKVVCLSEVPLHQIHLLTQDISGRRYKFKPYGLVFHRKFLIGKGAQPAIYINNYDGHTMHRQAADALFDYAVKDRFKSDSWKMLPLLNAMNEKYDFTWEREWRVVDNLDFTLEDLVCVILPNDMDPEKLTQFSDNAIPVISPGWTYEQIIAEFSVQQRATKRSLTQKFEKLQSKADNTSA